MTVDKDIMEFEKKGLGNSEKVMDFLGPWRCTDPERKHVYHSTFRPFNCMNFQTACNLLVPNLRAFKWRKVIMCLVLVLDMGSNHTCHRKTKEKKQPKTEFPA
jgi:hypothetical protein